MRRMVLPLAICMASAVGQSSITPPQLGWISSAGQLRPVLGLAASFVLGDGVTGSVVSSSFSDSFGLAKTNSAVLVLDRSGHVLFQSEAVPGPALFAFLNDGTPALVYLPQSKSLLTWNSDHLEASSFDVQGTVLALGTLNVVVKREDGLWLTDLNGGNQAPISRVDGPILLRSDGSLVYSDSESLIIRNTDGTERSIDGAITVASFEQMSQDWVHITEQESTRHFAVRLQPGHEQLFQLPDGAQ